MLNTHDPYALPSERSECPVAPDSADTHSSGADVPNPIITMPMMKRLTPNAFAKALAPSTNIFALHASAASPPTTNAMESQIEISGYMSVWYFTISAALSQARQFK